MVEVCLEEYLISDVNLVKTPLVDMNAKLYKFCLFEDVHTDCQLYEQNLEGCALVKKDIQGLIDHGILQANTKRKEDDVVVVIPRFYIPKPLEITC